MCLLRVSTLALRLQYEPYTPFVHPQHVRGLCIDLELSLCSRSDAKLAFPTKRRVGTGEA
jgi:hypothetical protein